MRSLVPPTIHALLQARIDSLDRDVRMVMERGAVEGEVFHLGAVAELSPDPLRSDVESHLATLVRKEFIRSAPPTFPADEGFRFRHLLIRDAAYESLPKATRALLHERFADWLATHDLIETDEIVGYHLEQAHRYRAELNGRTGRSRDSPVARPGISRPPGKGRLNAATSTLLALCSAVPRACYRIRTRRDSRLHRTTRMRYSSRAHAKPGTCFRKRGRPQPANAGSRRSIDGDHEDRYGQASSPRKRDVAE